MLLTIVPVILLLDQLCHVMMAGLEQLLPMQHPPNVDYLVTAATISALVLAIYEGFYFYHRWRQSVLETETLRRENMQSQLEGLKNQVNPHFLFNSLNTLVYLIPEDSQRAVRFVQQLSKVYRYILEIRDQPLISLREEMNFLDAYLFLLQERFGDNLQVDIRIDPAAYSLQLIPLSLQMLFENVIKHNIISQEQPLQVTVTTSPDHDSLRISNRLQRKKEVQPSTRVGLDNIRRRYAFYTHEDVLVEEKDGWFAVQLPLLHLQASAAQQSSRP
jgi:LytS/YehU family sensor histidine kinase